MPDRIVTATAADGSISIVAGITTGLVREAQQRHKLAPTASAALGRLVTAAALLGAALKGPERLSLQIAGDGPLRRLAAEVFISGPHRIGARAYTPEPAVDLPLNARGKFDVAGAVGGGRLQVTRSYEVGQPYVGVVALASGEIGDDIAAYLVQSEQIPSVVALGVLANPSGIKASGGAIAQVMPGAHESTIVQLEERARALPPVTTMIDGGATPEDIARALAGSLDVKIHEAFDVEFACRCTLEKVEVALLGLGRDELAKMAREQEETEAICEFCTRRYVLSRDEVGSLISRLEQRAT